MSKNRIFIPVALIILFCVVNICLFKLANFLREERTEEMEELISVLPTPEGIRKILTTIQDPGIGINIVDLGLVRDIEVKPDNRAIITVIFTSPFCPLMDSIVSQIKKRVKKINGIEDAEVRIDKTVVWHENMITENGKRKLEELHR